MNAHSSQPSKPFSPRRLLANLDAFARREPFLAMTAAVSAGLLINLLPKRAVITTAATLGSALLQPALLALGLTKAVELCCQRDGARIEPLFLTPAAQTSNDVTTSSRPSQWINP